MWERRRRARCMRTGCSRADGRERKSLRRFAIINPRCVRMRVCPGLTSCATASIESVNPNPTIAWFDGPWTGDLKQLVSNKCVYEQKWTLMCEIYNYFIHSHTRQTIPALHCIHPQHTHSPRTSTCTTHPAIPSQLPSTTLLCTQLTNTCKALLAKWHKM